MALMPTGSEEHALLVIGCCVQSWCPWHVLEVPTGCNQHSQTALSLLAVLLKGLGELARWPHLLALACQRDAAPLAAELCWPAEADVTSLACFVLS